MEACAGRVVGGFILVNPIVVNQAISEIEFDANQLDDATIQVFLEWLALHIEKENPVCAACAKLGTRDCAANWIKKHSTSTLVFFAEYLLILSRIKAQERDL